MAVLCVVPAMKHHFLPGGKVNLVALNKFRAIFHGRKQHFVRKTMAFRLSSRLSRLKWYQSFLSSLFLSSRLWFTNLHRSREDLWNNHFLQPQCGALLCEAKNNKSEKAGPIFPTTPERCNSAHKWCNFPSLASVFPGV